MNEHITSERAAAGGDAPSEHVAKPASMAAFIRDRLRARPPQTPRLRISQAGADCERDVYYRVAGVEQDPDSDEGLLKMALGTALDSHLLRDDEEHLTLAQKTVAITMGGITVTGTADLVFYGPGGPRLVSDMKVVGESTWDKVQERPKHEHRAQVNLYAYGLGAPQWSVCYVRAATGEMLEHFGDTDTFGARRDFGLFEVVAYWIGKGTPPPRPYEDIEEEDGTVKVAKDAFPCRYCRSRTTCWAGARKDENDEQPVQEAG